MVPTGAAGVDVSNVGVGVGATVGTGVGAGVGAGGGGGGAFVTGPTGLLIRHLGTQSPSLSRQRM
jgi:hypothetical protein